jgi:site-specific DNA-methyltransferase (adenine-specific)
MTKIQNYKPELLQLDQLEFAEYNPRDWDAESEAGLGNSLEQFGNIQTITVNRRTWDNDKLVIVGGHYRVHTLRNKNQKEAWCIVVEFDEVMEKAANLTLNNQEISGKFNDKVYDILDYLKANYKPFEAVNLGRLDLSLKTLKLSTPDFSDRNKEIDFDQLAKEYDKQVEADSRQVITQLGDYFEFRVGGQVHSIRCSSSLDVDFSFAGIDLVYTDPPYGIDVTKPSKTSPINNGKYPEIAGDSDTEVARLFYNNCVKSRIKDYIIWGYNYFAHWLPPTRGLIVWDKDVPTGMSFADGETAGIIEVRDGEIAWTNQDRNLQIYPFHWIGNVIGKCDEELNLNSNQKRYHPTQKPVELQVKILQDWAKDSKTILDGFLGSGSSLIATHLLGKNMIGFEIIPHYVDMIMIRFIAHLQSRNQQFTILKNGVEMTEGEINQFKL